MPHQVHQFSAGQGTGDRDDYQVSRLNTRMFENLGLRGVSDVSGQSISLRDLDVVEIDVDDYELMSVRRNEVFRRALTSWPESNDEDRIAIAGYARSLQSDRPSRSAGH